jgi:hypothetical protein
MDLKNGQILLSREDVMAIPERLLPMVVLSDNLRSFFSMAIKAHSEGCYNHLMWLIRPGVIASQNLTFQAQPVRDYFNGFRMKFWHCPSWTPEQRKAIIDAIETDLKKPWYKRIYDFVAIIGQGIGIPSLQTPGIDICSDKGKYLNDINYDLKHPDPEQVNHWLMTQRKYEVYGRYMPD